MKKDWNLEEWLTRQSITHPRSIDLSLDRVRKVAQRLEVLKQRVPVITVAGTNGKGSVVTWIDFLARRAGRNTGVFTSPHLIRYHERIRTLGFMPTDKELIRVFGEINQARQKITLTYFEFSLLAALLIFRQHDLDLIILEVGLGGRLDATNIIDPTVAVITSIGMDHSEWLGPTVEDIGREKAGILRRRRPVVLGTPKMPRSVFEAIENLSAKVYLAERDFSWLARGDRWEYVSPRLLLSDLQMPALQGSIQLRNISTAIAAIRALPKRKGMLLTPLSVNETLQMVDLDARMQIVPRNGVEWIIDVAHNEPAAQVLVQHLQERPCTGRTLMLISILEDKDSAAMSAALQAVADCWIVCTLTAPRGMRADSLAFRMDLPINQVTLASSVAAGCELAVRCAQPGDRVVACGSFLVAGAVLQWLGVEVIG